MERQENKPKLRLIKGGKNEQEPLTEGNSNSSIVEQAKKISELAENAARFFTEGDKEKAQLNLENAQTLFSEFKKNHPEEKKLIKKLGQTIRTSKSIVFGVDVV